MNNNVLPVDLPTFVDGKGDAYYQKAHVENRLLGGRNLSPSLVPNSFRRHATPIEIPALERLGMRAGNQRQGRRGVTLIRKDAVENMLLVSRRITPPRITSKQRLKKMMGLKKPPFSFVKLVAQALLASSLGGLTGREIEEWISRQYSNYHSFTHKLFTSATIRTVLSQWEFFAKQPPSKWQIKEEFKSFLSENAYLPDYVKKITPADCNRLGMRPSSATTIGPKQYQPEITVVGEETENAAEIPPEVEILPKENQYVSFDTSVKTEHQNLPHHAANLVDASTKKTEPGISNTVNLVNAVNAPPLKKIKVETIVDLEEDDKMPINDTSQLALQNTPKTSIQCPICDAEFNSKESLGDHVSSHRKAPLDPTKIAKDAIQNVASLFGGQMTNRDSSPIFVFSGNVYFSSNPPAS